MSFLFHSHQGSDIEGTPNPKASKRQRTDRSNDDDNEGLDKNLDDDVENPLDVTAATADLTMPTQGKTLLGSIPTVVSI